MIRLYVSNGVPCFFFFFKCKKAGTNISDKNPVKLHTGFGELCALQ